MWLVAGILALILEALAVVVVRSSWREWRKQGGPPDSEWLGRFKDRAGRSKLDRGGLVLGFNVACMGVIIGVGGVIDWNQPNTAMAWAFVAALTGFFPSIALYWLIVSFNRPKFLVPPRHRNEPGVFGTAWRRWREERSSSFGRARRR